MKRQHQPRSPQTTGEQQQLQTHLELTRKKIADAALEKTLTDSEDLLAFQTLLADIDSVVPKATTDRLRELEYGLRDHRAELGIAENDAAQNEAHLHGTERALQELVETETALASQLHQETKNVSDTESCLETLKKSLETAAEDKKKVVEERELLKREVDTDCE